MGTPNTTSKDQNTNTPPPVLTSRIHPIHTSKMLIKVRTLTGKEIELDIEPDYKVSQIKEKVEEKEGIPPVQQRLIFGGKQMADEKTATEYALGAVRHYILCLRCVGACACRGFLSAFLTPEHDRTHIRIRLVPLVLMLSMGGWMDGWNVILDPGLGDM